MIRFPVLRSFEKADYEALYHLPPITRALPSALSGCAEDEVLGLR
jgi:hypothetical protein